MNKEQIKVELMIADAQGYKQSAPIDATNFISESDNLTVNESYKGIATGDYGLQKWVNANGEKMIGVKSTIQLSDNANQPIFKKVFGDYEVGSEMSLQVIEATDKKGNLLLNKNSGKPYRNFKVSVLANVGNKVAEKI